MFKLLYSSHLGAHLDGHEYLFKVKISREKSENPTTRQKTFFSLQTHSEHMKIYIRLKGY